MNGDSITYLFDSFGVERTPKEINRQKTYYKIYMFNILKAPSDTSK